VEIVDEDGNTQVQQIEVDVEEPTEPPEEPIDEESEENKKQRKDSEISSKCDWRRLFKLYLKKLRTSGVKNVHYSHEKRKSIREAFKVVCENPEEAIRYLLNII